MPERERHGLYRSLRVQLLVYMVLLISIPLLVMTIFGNYFYAQAIDEQATSYTRQMLNQVQTNIDSNLHAVDQIITYLAQDERVRAFLQVEDFYDPKRVWTLKPAPGSPCSPTWTPTKASSPAS